MAFQPQPEAASLENLENVDSSQDSGNKRSDKATVLPVPLLELTCVEHPCIVKNPPAAIQTLGGDSRIERFLNSKLRKKTLGLSLQGSDSLSRPILSQPTQTTDVVLKLTVPKRTGRRRLKGSNDEFKPYDIEADSFLDTATIRSVMDNPDKVKVTPVGVVWDSHRFRSIPDMQYDLGEDDLARRMREKLISLDCSNPQNAHDRFEIDTNFNDDDGLPGFSEKISLGPPAAFCNINAQFNYAYEQNPSLRTMEDPSGSRVTVNLQAMRGHITHAVPSDSPTIPSESPVPLAPIESLHPDLQKAINELRQLLEVRPIVTRRASRNLVDKATVYCQRFAWAYVGYVFKSGPWKDCLVKFGLDPRKDPACRKYQTITFQFSDPEQLEPSVLASLLAQATSADTILQPSAEKPTLYSKKASATSHLFDGTFVNFDWKTWQICDIVDPALARFIEKSEYVSTPDLTGNGWFKNGTGIILRACMKDKIYCLMAGYIPDDSRYEPFYNWSTLIDADPTSDPNSARQAENRTEEGESAGPAFWPQLVLPENATERQKELSLEIRSKLSSIPSYANSEARAALKQQRKGAKTRGKKPRGRGRGGSSRGTTGRSRSTRRRSSVTSTTSVAKSVRFADTDMEEDEDLEDNDDDNEFED